MIFCGMGNSGSGLRKFGSEFGSTRSVPLSLPSELDRKTYSHPDLHLSASSKRKHKRWRKSPTSTNNHHTGSTYDQVDSAISPRTHSLGSIYQASQHAGAPQHQDPWSSNRNLSSYELNQTSYQLKLHRSQAQIETVGFTRQSLQAQKTPVKQINSLEEFQHGHHHNAAAVSSLDKKLYVLKQQRHRKIGNSSETGAAVDAGIISELKGRDQRSNKPKKLKRAPLPPRVDIHVDKARQDTFAIVSSANDKNTFFPSSDTAGLSDNLTKNNTESSSLLEEIERVLTQREIRLTPNNLEIAIPTPDYEDDGEINILPDQRNNTPEKPRRRKKKRAPQVPIACTDTTATACSREDACCSNLSSEIKATHDSTLSSNKPVTSGGSPAINGFAHAFQDSTTVLIDDDTSNTSQTVSSTSYDQVDKEDGATNVVPIHVLGGGSNRPTSVRLLQRTTLHNDVPTTIAPKHNTEELSSTNIHANETSKREISYPQIQEQNGDQEADSGHDEMSESSFIAESSFTKEHSVPEFVFRRLAESATANNEIKTSISSTKTTDIGIKQMRKSVKEFESSLGNSKGHRLAEFVSKSSEENENWSLAETKHEPRSFTPQPTKPEDQMGPLHIDTCDSAVNNGRHGSLQCTELNESNKSQSSFANSALKRGTAISSTSIKSFSLPSPVQTEKKSLRRQAPGRWPTIDDQLGDIQL